MSTRLKTAALIMTVTPFLALGACATNEDVQALRDEVKQAQASADKAAQEAREAKAAAAAAQEKADIAARTAGGASKKADRMFRESLRK